MATRKLLYHFNRPPYGTVFHTEGWRASVGATAGIDEHQVTLLMQSDGVYYALKNADRAENLGYEGTLKKAGAKFYAVREDVEARGISQDELAADITLIPKAETGKLYQEADFCLDW
ncbi:MAG: DsrH/TusB family sulfur metabolism protein [Candidatus Desantisbacteria bacterium]